MLDQWLASLSRNTLAFFAIIGGIALVILFSPPHSVCDSQEEVFKKALSRYFFIDKKQQAIIKKSYFDLAIDACRYDGKPGSCYNFFESLIVLRRELSMLTSECVAKEASIPQIKKALWEGVELMVQLAWGEKGPDNFMEKKGWLTEADVALFCGLQKQIFRAGEKSKWESFREKQFSALPGADKLERNEAWSRMLFSVKCESYE